MITTTKGLMDESTLVCTQGTSEDVNQKLDWIEYRECGSDEIIHRSVHLHLKCSPFDSQTVQGAINGE